MFGSRRGGPRLIIPLLIAVAFGYLLAGGIGSAIGALLFLPLLILKVAFMFFLFGMLLRFAGGGRPWPRDWADHKHGRWAGADERSEPTEEEAKEEAEERDWEEALRAAKREIDKLFPNPRE